MEVGRALGQLLKATPGQSGMSWVAKCGREFMHLSDLDLFMGAGWNVMIVVTSTGQRVRLFVHDLQLADVEFKWSGATQVCCSPSPSLVCCCIAMTCGCAQTLGARIPYVREFNPDTPEANIRDLPFIRPEPDSALAGAVVTVLYKPSLSLRAEVEELGTVRLPTDCTLQDAISHYFLTLYVWCLEAGDCYELTSSVFAGRHLLRCRSTAAAG